MAINTLKNYFMQSPCITDRDPLTSKARSAIIELNPKGNNVVWNEPGFSVLSNTYLSDIQRARQFVLNEGARIHNEDRLARLNKLVGAGEIDRYKAVEILQDSWSPYSKTKVDFSPSSILVPNQVNSIIFLPDELKILVGEGPAPSSYSDFYEFSFEQMESGSSPKKFIPKINRPTESFVAFKNAYYENGRKGSFKRGCKYINRAYDLSDDCSYNLQFASCLMKFNKIDIALHVLIESQICDSFNPHQKAMNSFFIGLIMHKNNKFDKANDYYREAINYSPSKDFKQMVQDVGVKKSINKKNIKEYADIDIKLMDSIW